MLLMLRVSHDAYDASGPFAPDVAHAFESLAAPDEIWLSYRKTSWLAFLNRSECAYFTLMQYV